MRLLVRASRRGFFELVNMAYVIHSMSYVEFYTVLNGRSKGQLGRISVADRPRGWQLSRTPDL